MSAEIVPVTRGEVVAAATTTLEVIDRPIGLDHAQVHLVECVNDAANLLRWLSERDHVAVDTETTGLGLDGQDHVRLFQIGDDRTSYVVPFDRWGGVVEEIVRKYDGTYVGHNMPFDYRQLAHHDIMLPTYRCRDTRIMLHVLSSTQPLALKDAGTRYVDPRAKLGQSQLEDAIGKNGGWTWETIPISYQPYWAYAGLDTILTFQLDQYLYPRVMNDAPLSFDLEMAVLWVCERMERFGTYVDRDYVRQLTDELEQTCRDIEEWCRTYHGVAPGRSSQVIDALSRMGATWTKRTQGGAVSLDKEVLAELAPHFPLAQAVYDHRRADRVVGTYLGKYLAGSERDGLLHPSINTIGGTSKSQFENGGSGRGVRTNRMSMSGYNLQNVPTRTVFGAKIRNSFASRYGDEGRWVKADFDQIEMRILAHLAEDEGMIKAFTSEGDFFVNMAREIFSDPTITKKDPRRQPVKNSGYAKIYGAGLDQFAKTAGMIRPDGAPDVDAARAFLNRFDQLYPGASRLARQVESHARRTYQEDGVAYVRSFLTNRRYTGDRDRDYALLNYLIQGGAGEIMKMKIVQADAAGLGPYMMFPVHDELDLDVPIAEYDDALVTLQDVMNDPDLLRVPITAGVSVGQRWGSLVDLEDVA